MLKIICYVFHVLFSALLTYINFNFGTYLSVRVGATLPTGQLSNIPWRRTGVKYTNNEAYFDVIEEIDAIIDKSGSTVIAEIQGYVSHYLLILLLSVSERSGYQTQDWNITWSKQFVIGEMQFNNNNNV